MKKSLWLLALLMAPLASGVAQEQSPASAKPTTKATDPKLKCTNGSCSNTATGEDPSDIAERDGAKILQDMRASASERERWELTPLYSSSKKPERLTLTIIQASGFSMRLQPQNGYLSFEKNGVTHTFDLAATTATANNPCPRYGISVVDAASDYAVIKKNCFIAEYAPGRFHKETEYFIYDMQSASMRSFWTAATEDKNIEGMLVTPEPALKRNANGFQLDWTVSDLSLSKTKKYPVHLRYLRQAEKTTKKLELVCTDLSAPKGEGLEQGACEGRGLALIPK